MTHLFSQSSHQRPKTLRPSLRPCHHTTARTSTYADLFRRLRAALSGHWCSVAPLPPQFCLLPGFLWAAAGARYYFCRLNTATPTQPGQWSRHISVCTWSAELVRSFAACLLLSRTTARWDRLPLSVCCRGRSASSLASKSGPVLF